MDGVVIRPCLPFHGEARTAGPLCSTGITPLPRSYGPFRLPLAFGRLPGFVARPTLVRRFRGGARRVSPVDFTRPCRRAAAATPPKGPIETRGGRNLLPSPSACGLSPRIGSIEATCAFTPVAARQLACRPQSGFVDGLQLTRFPVWLPSKLRGFWFFPRWVCLPPSVLAFWSYKLTSVERIGRSQLNSSVRLTVEGA
jgi:hypothetical protein